MRPKYKITRITTTYKHDSEVKFRIYIYIPRSTVRGNQWELVSYDDGYSTKFHWPTLEAAKEALKSIKEEDILNEEEKTVYED